MQGLARLPDADAEGILIYCRPGFEAEGAAELLEAVRGHGGRGQTVAKENSGFVFFQPDFPWPQQLRFDELIFARQLIVPAGLIERLPASDRLTPLLAHARTLTPVCSAIWLEAPDTNEGKALSAFTRKFATPFTAAARKCGLLIDGSDAPRLHVFFLDSTSAYVGLTVSGNASAWPMGIPRLKMPRGAPSRSTLKLEEALLTFLPRADPSLRAGMTAVDLGAAPGGWTWQLVRRNLRVTAVDNGRMHPGLLESGLVEHLRVDAFRYRPVLAVDWLVCDVVEQPARIAALIALWGAKGWCRRAISNLKLPMKKRYEEVKRCRARIADALQRAGVAHTLRFKQLYHDREEVTGYLALGLGRGLGRGR